MDSSSNPVFSEPGVVVREDGTVTQVLKYPLKAGPKGDQLIDELTYREILAKDLEAIGGESNEHTAQIKMIAQLTGLTVIAVKGMKAKDYMLAGRLIKAMVGNEVSTGGGA